MANNVLDFLFYKKLTFKLLSDDDCTLNQKYSI